MCGIYGFLALDRGLSQPRLESMGRVLQHRGPDDEGFLNIGPMSLGFRRLSIIDPPGGKQPMANEDGTVWLVFNGEIYNHAEIRPLMEARGHHYATNSDSESILHLYEEYGDECVEHLRGMFAFAIWDVARKRLFCARDRLGIKPFYYVATEQWFAFASEIKSLLECPGTCARLNKRALPEFFALGYLSSGETLFDGVRKLMPGFRMHIELKEDDCKPILEQYWDLSRGPVNHALEEDECVGQFRDLFSEAVRIHLRSDVPLGVFLSGGLDSSSIAAVATDLLKQPIQTFSVGYAEDGYSELPYARITARHIGAIHHEVILSPEAFFASLPQLIWHEDEPLVWPSSVSLAHVSRLASGKVKVVLSGEGADEILAGYLKYRVTLWNLKGGRLYRQLVPAALRDFLRDALKSTLLPDSVARKLRHSFLYQPEAFEQIYFDNFYSAFPLAVQPDLFTRAMNEELHGVDPYRNSMRFLSSSGSRIELNDLLYLDIKTYLVELLMKQDQMSMASSIESRVPFLDHELVRFVFSLPSRYTTRHFSGKYLLRKAMAGQLPDCILRRAKKGFPTPIRPWLRNQLFDRLSDILTDGRLAQRGVTRDETVRSLVSAHKLGSSHATECCWRLLNFELWNRIFLDHDHEYARSSVAEMPEAVARA